MKEKEYNDGHEIEMGILVAAKILRICAVCPECDVFMHMDC